MKRFFRLASVAFFAACTAFAAASPLDYKTNVLDPPPPIGPTPYPLVYLTSAPFNFSFHQCLQGELPSGMFSNGCFAGVNSTGYDWTSIQLTFPNDQVLASQPVSCAPAPSDNIFSTAACILDPDGLEYSLTFSNGVIHNGDLFFITEDGVVPPDTFPPGHAVVLTSTTTPEPSSFVLLGTGLLVTALFAAKARS